MIVRAKGARPYRFANLQHPGTVRIGAAPVMRHRLALNFQARTENVDVDQVITQLLQAVPTPS